MGSRGVEEVEEIPDEVFPEEECIQHLENQKYIRNDLPSHILRDHGYRFPLHQFCCYCVGIIDGEKVVECIQILFKSNTEKLSQFCLRWFHPIKRNKSVIFWVNSGASLKKNFFLFTDKLNFFRSTFLYYPEMDTYFRLSSLLDYIYLPKWESKRNHPIYQTPLKFSMYDPPSFFKKRNSISSKQTNSTGGKKLKREHHFRKSLIKLSSNDFDHFLHRKYPEVFHEIDRLI